MEKVDSEKIRNLTLIFATNLKMIFQEYENICKMTPYVPEDKLLLLTNLCKVTAKIAILIEEELENTKEDLCSKNNSKS